MTILVIIEQLESFFCGAITSDELNPFEETEKERKARENKFEDPSF